MKEAVKIYQLIKNSNNIVITSHLSPDGDSIGSSLALHRFITVLGKSSQICHPDSCPDFLKWIKGDDIIIDFENHKLEVIDKMKSADLIFCLDYNTEDRLGSSMGKILSSCKAKKVMIDHHVNPSEFVDITISESSASSTSELVYELINYSGNLELMNSDIGSPIYLGIISDTGSFRFSSVSSRTHHIVSHLLNIGVDHVNIYQKTFDNNRLDKIKLHSYIISNRLEVINSYKVSIISVTEDILSSFNYIKGDTEGLVNSALSIKDIEVAAFFTQKGDKVKISLRSKGLFSVNTILTDHFNGGGHKYAAGGINNDSIENTILKFKSLLPKYF